MIELCAVRAFQWMLNQIGRRELVWGVCFHQQSFQWNLYEHIAPGLFAFVCEIPGETEPRTEVDEGFDHFQRASVAVEEDSPFRCWVLFQQESKAPERLQTMDARREVAFCSEFQLPEKRRFLIGDGRRRRGHRWGSISKMLR